MTEIVSTFSKYIIVIMCAIYTCSCFFIYLPFNRNKQEQMLDRQQFALFLFHFICYIILILQLKEWRVVALYFAQAVFFRFAIWFYQHLYKDCSRLLMNNMLFLLSIGCVMLTRLSFEKAVKQFLIVMVSYVIACIVPIIIKHAKWLSKLGILYGIIGILCLMTVFVVGATKNGSTNWIQIGGFAMQPSEFVKIIYVFFIAALFEKSRNFRQVMLVSVMAAIHVLILVAEKDLGGALLYFVIYIVMCYVATGRAVYFFGGLLGGSLAGSLAYLAFSHVRVRIQAWQDPWSIIEGRGYQITQSLFAIGSGGWFGSGITLGRPKDIPVVDTDFIFSAIAEELGILFAIFLIMVCLDIFINIMNVSLKVEGLFYKLIGVGLGCCFLFQIFLNIGGATKFIPSTGVTLPLISYGGSSVTSTLLMFGIIQGLCIMVNKKENTDVYEEDQQNKTNGKRTKQGLQEYKLQNENNGFKTGNPNSRTW